MSEIRVEPAGLGGAGGSLVAAGQHLGAVGGAVDAASGAAGATGDTNCAGSYARMCATWSYELERLGAGVGAVGRIAQWAGALYQAVDSALFPGSAGDR